MRVRYEVFQSSIESWQSLFNRAAEFATQVGPSRLIAISHSEGRGDLTGNGVVTVWYWDEEPEKG
jgi:hypothetical protein